MMNKKKNTLNTAIHKTKNKIKDNKYFIWGGFLCKILQCAMFPMLLVRREQYDTI